MAFIRFVIFLGLTLSLIVVGLAKDVDPKLESLGNGAYAFYIVGLPPKSPLIENYINNTVYCNSENAGSLREVLNKNNIEIRGESISIKNLSVNVLNRLNYQRVKESVVDNIKITYAFSAFSGSFVKVGGRKINLQIAVNGNVTTIGFPVILGSY